MNTVDAKRVLETALICAQQPLAVRDMRVLTIRWAGGNAPVLLTGPATFVFQGGIDLPDSLSSVRAFC